MYQNFADSASTIRYKQYDHSLSESWQKHNTCYITFNRAYQPVGSLILTVSISRFYLLWSHEDNWKIAI